MSNNTYEAEMYEGKLSVCFQIDTDSWLKERAERSDEKTERYHEWCRENGLDPCRFDAVRRFCSNLESQDEEIVKYGLYGEGFEPIEIDTEAKYDSVLDRGLYFVDISVDDEPWVFIDGDVYDDLGYRDLALYDWGRAWLACCEPGCGGFQAETYSGGTALFVGGNFARGVKVTQVTEEELRGMRKDLEERRVLRRDNLALPGLETTLPPVAVAADNDTVLYCEDDGQLYCPRCLTHVKCGTW